MMIWSFSRIIKNYASLLPPRDWSFCARQQRTCLLQHQRKHQTMKHFKLSQTCTHCARQKVQMIEMNKYRDHILFKLNNNKKVKSTTTAAKNTCHIQLYSKSIRQTTLNIIWSVSSYQNQMRETLWVNIMIFWNSALDLSFQAALSFYLGYLWGEKSWKHCLRLKNSLSSNTGRSLEPIINQRCLSKRPFSL